MFFKSLVLKPCDLTYSTDKAKRGEMLALYDFTSRNNKEITVRKGDIVEASTRNLNHKTIVCLFFLLQSY